MHPTTIRTGLAILACVLACGFSGEDTASDPCGCAALCGDTPGVPTEVREACLDQCRADPGCEKPPGCSVRPLSTRSHGGTRR